MTIETDRELLELAAKAAGIEFDADASIKDMLATIDGKWWSPLTDDGDALRLAVKLDLLINVDGIETEVMDGAACSVSERHENDANAATRRAIVRAAAEIGRAMP